MNLAIEHLPEHGRFEVVVDGQTCEADYRLSNGVMTITHTGVPAPLGGRGIAAALMQAAFEHARSAGLKVRPLCSYADAWLRRHPEFAALRA